MTNDKLYECFIKYVGTTYDALAYTWQFSSWKRLKMDRASYLELAEIYFENYPPTEKSIFKLIDDFERDVEILEVIDSNTK